MRARLPASVTTTKDHRWLLPPVGACWAIEMHSRRTSRSTGRSRSSRRRTARVVVSSRSVIARSMPPAGRRQVGVGGGGQAPTVVRSGGREGRGWLGDPAVTGRLVVIGGDAAGG